MPVGVGVWVRLGGTHIAAGSDSFSPVCGGGGLGTLLGPEKTSAVAGFSWCDHFWSVRSNAGVGVRGGCGGGPECGCVLSVA